MELFDAAFWVMMLVGLLAVGLPAYWLASEWWQDQERSGGRTVQSPGDPE